MKKEKLLLILSDTLKNTRYARKKLSIIINPIDYYN